MRKVDVEHIEEMENEIADFLNSVYEEKGDTKIAVTLIETQPNDIEVEDLIERILEWLRRQRLLAGVYSIRHEHSKELSTESNLSYQLDDCCYNTRNLELLETRVYILVKVSDEVPCKLLRVSYNIEAAI